MKFKRGLAVFLAALLLMPTLPVVAEELSQTESVVTEETSSEEIPSEEATSEEMDLSNSETDEAPESEDESVTPGTAESNAAPQETEDNSIVQETTEDDENSLETDEVIVPEDNESTENTLFQICTQVFEELGLQISILSEEDIVLKDAVIRIISVESIELESIEEAVQWMAEAALEEKIREADGVSLSIYNMYADLEVSGSSSYAFQLEISYKDEQGNDCVLRPEENNNLQIVIEALNSVEVPGNELQSVEVFSLTQDGAAVFSSEQGENSPFIYTISAVKYAAKADAAMIAAEQKAWDIINTYADPDYFLSDPYKSDMTEAQYEELHQAALTATAGCSTQYDKIKAITGFVADRIYYDYCYLVDKENHPTYFNPYEVYTQRRTVCAGYARLVRTLCISLGIPCMDIIGDNHEYNAIYDREQNKWIFADATWCSLNSYWGEQGWTYRGCNYLRFDLKPEEIALLTSHEVYGVGGLLDRTFNSVYYSLIAPKENWVQTDNWYLVVSETKQAKAKAIDFAGFSVIEVWDVRRDTVEMDLTDTKVTNIGRFAFYKCSSLEKIFFPDSLTEIGESTFRDCEKLVQVDLSKTKLEIIGAHTFFGCSSLEKIIFPDSLTEIGEWAFSSCKKLAQADLSKMKLEKIGRGAFVYCSSLEKIIFPDSLTEIGEFAFSNCEKLMQADLSKTKLERIEERTFAYCSSLEKIIFPGSVIEIGAKAFRNCEVLSEIDLLKTKVKSIGDYAFYDCKALHIIKLPSTLTQIGTCAFAYGSSPITFVVTSLSEEDIHYPGENNEWLGRYNVGICTHVYKVKLDGNGATYGECGTVECAGGWAYSWPNPYQRSGYKFVNWNTKRDGSGTSYNDKDVIIDLTKEDGTTVTLYAQWEHEEEKASPFAVYEGYEFYRDDYGYVTCFNSGGTQVINEFKCDGTYTYYFQADGTAMRDRLTYHPDGVHVIYFDQNGHEVFDNFAYVGHNIPSMETGIATELNEYCYFNTFGYQYTDVVTWGADGTDRAGKLFYANTGGILERSGWFTFSDTVQYAGDGTLWPGAGKRGYANEADCSLMRETWTYDENGLYRYINGYGALE